MKLSIVVDWSDFKVYTMEQFEKIVDDDVTENINEVGCCNDFEEWICNRLEPREIYHLTPSEKKEYEEEYRKYYREQLLSEEFEIVTLDI